MGNGKRITVGNTTYPSKRVAARALGISRTSLRKAIKHGDYHGKPIITKTAPLPLKSRTLEFWVKTSQALTSQAQAKGDLLFIDDTVGNIAEKCQKSAFIAPVAGSGTVQAFKLRSGGGAACPPNSHHSTTITADICSYG